MFRINIFKKYFTVGVNRLANYCRTTIFIWTDLFLPNPHQAYYLVSNRCNFRCQMCPQWISGENEKQDELISEERMRELIGEMADAGITEFGISGGEPLLEKGKVIRLLEVAARSNLYTHLTTNGSLLDLATIRRLDDIGLGHLSLSIDAVGRKHDDLRGFSGAFARVEQVLKFYKECKFKNLKLKINFVLSGANLDEVLAVASLAVEYDCWLFVQPYDPYDYACAIKNKSDLPLWVRDIDKLKSAIGGLKCLKSKYPHLILNDNKHLDSIIKYYSGYQKHIRCLAGINSLSINPQGEVSFCKFGAIADLKNMNLKKYFNSASRKNVIKQSLACRSGCLLGCMFHPSFSDFIIDGVKRFYWLMKK